MNSIRPLVTITLLAVAGVYLYFKINETQPQLPVDVAEWTLPAQVEIREPSGTAPPSVAPTYKSPTSTGLASGASNFAPAATLPASASSAAAVLSPHRGAEAPSWVDSAPAGIAAAPAAATQMGPKSTTLPNLPPLPEIPSAASAQSTPPGIPEVTREGPAETGSSPQRGLSQTQPMSVTSSQGSSMEASPSPTSSSQEPSPSTATPQASLFGATRLAVQSALDRGEFSQALLLLSDWNGDPSLTPEENSEVDALLGQLAGSVIYSTDHRLEPPHLVQAGQRLEEIAKQYNVPWQLLAKINGIQRPDHLQVGQKLKVIRGPFSALIDLGDHRLTVMLARRYAGKFAISIDPQVTVEEGHWKVDQKLVTPGNLNMASSVPATSPVGQGVSGTMEEQSLILINTASEKSQITVLRGPGAASPGAATEPENRVIRLKTADVRDLFDILSVGSNVIIRR